jgi:hypothetical protein
MASPGPLGASTWQCDSWAISWAVFGCRPGCRLGVGQGVVWVSGVGWVSGGCDTQPDRERHLSRNIKRHPKTRFFAVYPTPFRQLASPKGEWWTVGLDGLGRCLDAWTVLDGAWTFCLDTSKADGEPLGRSWTLRRCLDAWTVLDGA